jgi:hypothetical protein
VNDVASPGTSLASSFIGPPPVPASGSMR